LGVPEGFDDAHYVRKFLSFNKWYVDVRKSLNNLARAVELRPSAEFSEQVYERVVVESPQVVSSVGSSDGFGAHQCLALAERCENGCQVSEGVSETMGEGDRSSALVLCLGLVLLILRDERVEGAHVAEDILAWCREGAHARADACAL
jgi:hypothetical protein